MTAQKRTAPITVIPLVISAAIASPLLRPFIPKPPRTNAITASGKEMHEIQIANSDKIATTKAAIASASAVAVLEAGKAFCGYRG